MATPPPAPPPLQEDETEARRRAEEELDYPVALRKCEVCGQWTKDYVHDHLDWRAVDVWLCRGCFERDGT